MGPLFPKFIPLNLTSKEVVKAYTDRFEPYSDFNFTSMYVYNVTGGMGFTFLNENLVVKFQEYEGSCFFLSMLGENEIEGSLETLIKYSTIELGDDSLKLVPEVVVQALNKNPSSKIKSLEDRDNFDYVYFLPDLAELRGRPYRAKKNFVNRFLRFYPHITTAELNLGDKSIQSDILELFLLWKRNKSEEPENTENESIAIQRVFELTPFSNITCLGLLDGNKLIAVSINELGKDGYSVGHFRKADIAYEGCFQMLERETARYLLKSGSQWLNFEQDLGIPGLRKSKESWIPRKFLKKYKLELTNNESRA